MSKHTPGPWMVRKRELDGELMDCFVTASDVNGFPYDAEILGDDEYRSENAAGEDVPAMERKLADCHLIAAAPELLEALQDMMPAFESRLGDYENAEWNDCWNKAIAAIAKAIGEQQ